MPTDPPKPKAGFHLPKKAMPWLIGGGIALVAVWWFSRQQSSGDGGDSSGSGDGGSGGGGGVRIVRMPQPIRQPHDKPAKHKGCPPGHSRDKHGDCRRTTHRPPDRRHRRHHGRPLPHHNAPVPTGSTDGMSTRTISEWDTPVGVDSSFDEPAVTYSHSDVPTRQRLR